MTLKELYEKKNIAVKASRDLLNKADAEQQRPFNAEESEQYAAWEKEIDECEKSIQELQMMEARRVRLLEIEQSMRQAVNPVGLQQAGADSREVIDKRTMVQKLRDLRSSGMSTQQATAELAKGKYDTQADISKCLSQFFLHGMHAVNPQLAERAGLQMDKDVSGGFLVMPEQFVARLIADLDRMVLMRSLATVIPLTGAESLGVPTRDTDIGDLTWTTELAVGSEDTSLAYGKRRLTPHPCGRYIKVSKDLMRIAAISPEAEVRSRLLYKAGTVQEAGFMTGTGAGSPLGVFTASAAGISTSRDVSTGNTSTSIQTDGLINAKYSLESQWLMNSNLRWIFHRDAISQIRKLKDGDGSYIWQPDIVSDPVERILNVPVSMSEYAPNTFTTGLYVGLIGDFSYYWIVDAYSIEIQRLTELFALTNQDGFIARFKADGMPVLQTAFARVKLG